MTPPGVMPTEGADLMLSLLVNKAQASDLTLHLFSNDYNPASASEAQDFVETPMQAGYATKLLNGSDWSVDKGVAVHVPQVFHFSGPLGLIYGYYVLGPANKVVAAERFVDGPYNILNNGDFIAVNIRLGGSS